MEGTQLRIFGDAAVWIVGRGIVSDADELNALQAKNAPGLRPAAIVADHHAHDRVAPVRSRAKGGKSEVAIFEISLFQLLVARAAACLAPARQMHLAISAAYFAPPIAHTRPLLAPPLPRQF